MTRYDKAISLLEEASRSGSRLGLERIYELCRRLGNPQDKPGTIHVAGTNGKGSFSAMLSSVLTAQGYLTGTFSSPSMLEVRDSIRIGGRVVSEDEFADAVIKAAAAAELMEDKPTEFELLTAAAFQLFSDIGCVYTVIECGMGGDGDSTNVITKPLLSVITNVSLDHCTFLGNTVAEIAGHKAGIIKQGTPAYFGGKSDDALKVISGEAERKGSELYTCASFRNTNYETAGLPSGTSVVHGSKVYHTPLFGTCQSENLVNVLNCIDILRKEGIVISEEAVVKGLEKVRWEGRFEFLSRDPEIVFDGAHNPDGMMKLCESIRLYFGEVRPAAVIGVLEDKDYSAYSVLLKPLISRVFAVSPDNPRALPSDKLAEVFSAGGIKADAYPSIADGLDAAYRYCSENGLPLLVIGSLYMYKDVVGALKYIKSK